MFFQTKKEIFRRCYEVALTSPDPSTQNGAVLVSAFGDSLAEGANSFPAGVLATPPRLERPLKYNFIEHAERHTIFNAAKAGTSTHGATLYCLWAACADCARAIIASGITEVVTHNFYTNRHQSANNAKPWDELISDAMTMFSEAGVRVTFYDENIMNEGEPGLLFDGKLVRL